MFALIRSIGVQLVYRPQRLRPAAKTDGSKAHRDRRIIVPVSILNGRTVYGDLAGLGIGIAYNCIISTINGWFPDRKGLATGVLKKSALEILHPISYNDIQQN